MGEQINQSRVTAVGVPDSGWDRISWPELPDSMNAPGGCRISTARRVIERVVRWLRSRNALTSLPIQMPIQNPPKSTF